MQREMDRLSATPRSLFHPEFMKLSSTQDPVGVLGLTSSDRDVCAGSETDRANLVNSLAQSLQGSVSVLGWDCAKQTLWFVIRDLDPTLHDKKTEELRSLVQNNTHWADFSLQMQSLMLQPHHQAIVATESGQLLGYEFVLREMVSGRAGPGGSVGSIGPAGLVGESAFRGLTDLTKRLSVRVAIQNFAQLGGNGKLFLAVPPHFLSDPQFTPVLANQWLQQAGVSPHQVVLKMAAPIVTDTLQNLAQALTEFRSFGYEVALEDADNGSFSLRAIAELRPNYIKVAREFVHDAARHHVKQELLGALVEFANRLSCRLVAAGIESVGTESAGIESAGTESAVTASEGIESVRTNSDANETRAWDSNGSKRVDSGSPIVTDSDSASGTAESDGNSPRSLGRSVHGITRSVTTFAADTPVSEVVNYFNDSDSTGIVIVQEEQPLGLVMREKLFQRLAFQYGYSLFWNREILNLMDRDPLILDEETPLEVASRLSMARDRERTYDLVLVTRGGKFAGVVTIQDLLDTITNAKIELARDANPLTGMPGNRRIEQEIERRIELARPFSIIYTDLDFFKWYNDQFGFQKGDLVINFTAGLLRDMVGKLGQPDDFIGHIGGDDFIIVTDVESPNVLCDAIIERFDGEIARLYPDLGKHVGQYEVTDRVGNKVPASGIAISLSILECRQPRGTTMACISAESGRLKKIAKEQVGSVCVKGVLGPADRANPAD